MNSSPTDLGVGQPAVISRKTSSLPLGQRCQCPRAAVARVRLGELPDHPAGDCRRQQRVAGGHGADGSEELLGRVVLEHEAARARAQPRRRTRRGRTWSGSSTRGGAWRRGSAGSPPARRAPASGCPSARRRGDSALAWLDRVPPLPASATTSMSGSSASSIRNPARTIAWSSTTRTLISWSSGVTVHGQPGAQHEAAAYWSAPAGHLAAEDACTRSRIPTSPWPQTPEPLSRAPPRRRPAPRPAPRSGRSCTSTSARLRVGVLEDVGEALLEDAVRRQVEAGAAARTARRRPTAARPDRRRGRPRPAGRARPDPGCGASSRARPRRAASRPAAGASRPGRCDRPARRCAAPPAARPASGGLRWRTAPTCSTITLIACATTSCSSRAIRARSSATASRAAPLAPARRGQRAPRRPRSARPAPAARSRRASRPRKSSG